MKLYEIDKAIENFEFQVDEVTGEILNINELDSLELNKHDKVENIACFIKNMNADVKALDEEIKSLQARKKAKQSKILWLSNYLRNSLNGSKFETPKVAINYRKSTVVDIQNEDTFIRFCKSYGLDDLYNVKIEEKANKTEIKKYIKENGIDELNGVGVSLVEKQNIQIK